VQWPCLRRSRRRLTIRGIRPPYIYFCTLAVSRAEVRLVFNLYTDGTPSIDDYKHKDDQIDECRGYSVSDIFCRGYTLYFWQGIKLRYLEYCQKQRFIEEILAEMERKRAVKIRLMGTKNDI